MAHGVQRRKMLHPQYYKKEQPFYKHMQHTQFNTIKRQIYHLPWCQNLNSLNWSLHIDTVVKKGNRSLGFVGRNIKTSNSNVTTLAYGALVRPILECLCQVWDLHTDNDIQH